MARHRAPPARGASHMPGRRALRAVAPRAMPTDAFRILVLASPEVLGREPRAEGRGRVELTG
jgi:hypothetical protein